MKLLISVFSVLPLCWLLAMIPAATDLPTPAVPTVDVCSENPYYAAAIIAMDWLGANPPAQPLPGDAYGHARLDALYGQLYAEGKVGPVPPPCLVTATTDLTVWGHPGVDYVGTMHAGDTAEVNGQDSEGNWWYVNTGSSWGWVSRQDTRIQPEAEISSIPIRD